ncbi:MAG: DNA-directed RNA polymerase subunit beta' [Bifidobacteriaceae bacterium]|jgi:DNA-directed RNA polymerase subunit beta'|nr:DNA-directed RNA polymerase subunit beta' [Bifidobacteriaceae bacterium]
MVAVTDFNTVRLSLANLDNIHSWSHGEVKKAETINYRTLKPEHDGLFCEKIFGPTHDWECSCGKYKRVRFKGIVCERCGVEVTSSKVRRERMGHIQLAAPVTHIWYFKGVPSRLAYMLDIPVKDIEKVIYFQSYLVVDVKSELIKKDIPLLQKELNNEIKIILAEKDKDVEARAVYIAEEIAEAKKAGKKGNELTRLRSANRRAVERIKKAADDKVQWLQIVWQTFKSLEEHTILDDEVLRNSLEDRYDEYFTSDIGASAIKTCLQNLNLKKNASDLQTEITEGNNSRNLKLSKRLKMVNAFIESKNDPTAMVLDAVPVLPPDLRPMVQLDGGRFATSDLNDLYRRVINRNNRLKKMLDLSAPRIIINNEKRMLQEAVDALFDNGRRGHAVTTPSGRPLKSISDMLKGKKGRFRQNLLGKRVDYSGRSVIVVGPTLKMHQCGLPKDMALELFRPFVEQRLISLQHATNQRQAKSMIERVYPVVWDVLEEVIKQHPVLLNRAPTLHRLGIQAFEPQLVEGKAVALHPLACTAFNADFDGDQMAVHLPLSVEAQAEARVLMLGANNILKPADGNPVTVPTQDMIIGLYHITAIKSKVKGEGRAFSSVDEAQMAYDLGQLDINAKCKIKIDSFYPDTNYSDLGETDLDIKAGSSAVVETTFGRTIFNECLPTNFPYANIQVGKKLLDDIVNKLSANYSTVQVNASLDALKDTGFKWASRSGVTISFSDVAAPEDKSKILVGYEKQALKIHSQYDNGLITDEERREELIDLWTQATEEVAESMIDNFPENNTVKQMVTSGARGNWMQIRQIAGMRGLVSNPKGEIIPRPIKSNYDEGLSVLEYFIASHGARKGLADTALRTADSGYLTRRLVDVSQDVIILENDCKTKRSLAIPLESQNGKEVHLETSIYARTLAQEVKDDKGNLIAKANQDISLDLINRFLKAGIKEVKVRSLLTCQSQKSACAACYGRSMATGKRVDVGESVGIVAAQSIGEPGTQLTMRTFHTGGVAGSSGDITQGLPRVTELFEARTPRGEAPIAEFDGQVKIEDSSIGYVVTITPDDKNLSSEQSVISKRSELLVKSDDKVKAGQKLCEGPVDPKKILWVLGPRQAQIFLLEQVQEVYRSQGVSINDKHIEVIVRQMLKYVSILTSGDTNLIPGQLADRTEFENVNRKAVKQGKKPATGRPELMGITKASLATKSWLSAASFQETTRVLTQAAIESTDDSLDGLKENVIIGNLIPSGTGLPVYHNSKADIREELKVTLYPNLAQNKVLDDDYAFVATADE